MTTATAESFTAKQIKNILTVAMARTEGLAVKADRFNGVRLSSILWDDLQGAVTVEESDGLTCILVAGKKYIPCNQSAQVLFTEWLERAFEKQQAGKLDSYGNPSNCFDKTTAYK